jgi:hypothetical protein
MNFFYKKIAILLALSGLVVVLLLALHGWSIIQAQKNGVDVASQGTGQIFTGHKKQEALDKIGLVAKFDQHLKRATQSSSYLRDWRLQAEISERPMDIL